MENLELIIIILTAITLLAILADKINFPLPILLVFIGLLISLVPGLPVIELNPDIVFLIFLPPLLYEAAWFTSWHDFRSNLRPITLAAVGLVLFTTFLVALVAHYLIPGIGWPGCFILGAIISPPDAVAAGAVTKGLGLSRRTLSIIEGESLLNDASGLIAYRYGIAALATGNFVFWKAGLDFLWVVAAGIGVGIAIGYILYLIHRYVTCDALIETTLTFLTPYGAYLVAEHLHVSGVLAVVTSGLYLSYRSSQIFSHTTRINSYAVWQTVVFILNGVIFILIGLQLRHVLKQIQSQSVGQLFTYGLLISLLVMFIRFIWVFPAAYMPRWISKKIRRNETISWRNVFVFSWTGMRGVVSMAAALALPLALDSGQPFPFRDLILFLTFCVIIFTLIIQGLSLPFIIKWLKLPKESLIAEEFEIRLKIAGASIVHIEENLSLGSINDNVLSQIKSKYEIKINHLSKTDLNGFSHDDVSKAEQAFVQYTQVQGELISVERSIISQLRREGKVNQEILRKLEHELDLEEARLGLERQMNFKA